MTLKEWRQRFDRWMQMEYECGWDMKLDGESGWRLTWSWWKYNFYSFMFYKVLRGGQYFDID